jgi:hypothetical protein
MVGPRFNFQQVPQGMNGGLNYYPLVGVVSGMQVTAASATTVANAGQGVTALTDLLVTISAGACRLDGLYHQLSSNLTNLRFATGATDMTTGTYVYKLYVNPRRIIPALTSAPGNPATNDIYIKVINIDDYQMVDSYLQWNGSAWVAYNAIQAPPSYNFNNLPFNDINATLDTALTNNVSFGLNNPEKNVYNKVNIPVALSKPGEAYVRKGSSLNLATITVVNGTATIVNYDDSLRLAL